MNRTAVTNEFSEQEGKAENRERPGVVSDTWVQDVVFLSRADRDIGVAFQSHPVGHASSRVEAKDSTILSSRDA